MPRTVLVTGTSSGLGLALAVRLAADGDRVFATMRDLDRQGPLQEAAAQAGVALDVLPLDVTDPESVADAVARVAADGGGIDVLVNNAGAGFAKNLEQASEDEMRWVTDVNYFGVVRCTRAVVPHLRQRGGGRIVNVTSVGGLVGQPFNELYCAAKFAVEGFTEALATVLPQHFGIHVTLVEPGGIRSAFAASATQATLGADGLPDDAYAPIFQAYLAGFQRRGAEADDVYQTPDEVAAVVRDVLASGAPPLRVRTSRWAEDLCAFKTAADPDGTRQTADIVARFF